MKPMPYKYIAISHCFNIFAIFTLAILHYFLGDIVVLYILFVPCLLLEGFLICETGAHLIIDVKKGNKNAD